MRTLAGSALILGGGLWAFLRVRGEHRRRRNLLSDLLLALERMGEEIRMARTPLPHLLDRLAAACRACVCSSSFRPRCSAARFSRAAARAARSGEDVGAVWRREAAALPLEPRDIEALRSLDLGGDEESICKGISLVTRALTRSLEESDARRPQEEKRTAALCFSAAALLVILLI